MLVLQNKGE